MTPEQRTLIACRGRTDLFYAPQPPVHGWDRPAKQICATCPLTGIHGPCVTDDQEGMDLGIRGGYTATERAVHRIVVQAAATCRWCGRTIVTSGRWYYCDDDCLHAWHNERKRRHRAA